MVGILIMLWESLKDLDFDLSHVITKFGSSVIMIGLKFVSR
jgi:hypothetical protein